jgi:hypothetical protein
MIDLDEMKQKWSAYDRKLDLSLTLNRELLSVEKLKGARSALQRLKTFAAVEAAIWLAWMIVIGNFVHANMATMKFALPAIALDLFALGNLIALIRQIVAVSTISYREPVIRIQRRIEELRIAKIRRVQINSVIGMVAWVLALIVALKGFFGVDAYRVFNGAWLVANVVFGLAMIPTSIWFSKKYGGRMNRNPFLQRLMQDLAGRNLIAAARSLAELSQFEQTGS